LTFVGVWLDLRQIVGLRKFSPRNITCGWGLRSLFFFGKEFFPHIVNATIKFRGFLEGASEQRSEIREDGELFLAIRRKEFFP